MSKCLKQISCPEERARQASRAPSIDCHADIYRHIRVAAAVLAVTYKWVFEKCNPMDYTSTCHADCRGAA